MHRNQASPLKTGARFRSEFLCFLTFEPLETPLAQHPEFVGIANPNYKCRSNSTCTIRHFQCSGFIDKCMHLEQFSDCRPDAPVADFGLSVLATGH